MALEKNKTKMWKHHTPHLPQVAAYLLCSVADNLPINTVITLDPKAGEQLISQLHLFHTPPFPSVLQQGELTTSLGLSQLHPQSSWLPVCPQDDMPVFDGTFADRTQG